MSMRSTTRVACAGTATTSTAAKNLRPTALILIEFYTLAEYAKPATSAFTSEVKDRLRNELSVQVLRI